MKNYIKLPALVLAAGLPCVAFAQLAGVHVPAAVNTESAFATFAIIGITLGALRDYARPVRPIAVNAAPARSAAPSLVVHRPAYGIRRGSEVARLAA